MGGKLGLGATHALGLVKLVTNSSVDIGAIVALPDERTQHAAAMMALTR
jgi:hypothetical protein